MRACSSPTGLLLPLAVSHLVSGTASGEAPGSATPGASCGCWLWTVHANHTQAATPRHEKAQEKETTWVPGADREPGWFNRIKEEKCSGTKSTRTLSAPSAKPHLAHHCAQLLPGLQTPNSLPPPAQLAWWELAAPALPWPLPPAEPSHRVAPNCTPLPRNPAPGQEHCPCGFHLANSCSAPCPPHRGPPELPWPRPTQVQVLGPQPPLLNGTSQNSLLSQSPT